MDPPQQTQAMQAEMVRVRRLVNSGKKTWDAVPPADQKVLDGVTKGKGKLMFEFGVQKMAEEAKMPKPPLGSTSTPSVPSTPPPFMKGK